MLPKACLREDEGNMPTKCGSCPGGEEERQCSKRHIKRKSSEVQGGRQRLRESGDLDDRILADSVAEIIGEKVIDRT